MAEPGRPERLGGTDPVAAEAGEPIAADIVAPAAERPSPAADSGGSILGRVRDLASVAVDMIGSLFARLRSDRRWVIVDGGDELSVHKLRKGRGSLVAAGSDIDGRAKWMRELAKAGEVELRLDPEKIIVRRIALPADGRGFLEQIIDHRLDRLTPWKREKVLYGFRVAEERKAENLIDVDFAATSRDVVASVLQRLGKLGVVPTRIGSAGEPMDRPLAVDLLRGSGDRRKGRRRIAAGILAATPVLLLALFLASLVFVALGEQRLQGAAADLQSRRLAAQAANGGDEAGQAALSLIEAKQPDGAAFLLIDRLAAAIPSDTFLSDLEIQPGSLRLKGSSANAPALIPLLEEQPGLDAVRFEAPVARDADGRDRFDIIADLGSGAEEESVP